MCKQANFALLLVTLFFLAVSPALADEPVTLHPQVKSFLSQLNQEKPPGWEELSPDEGRKTFSGLTNLFGERPEVAACEDRMAGGVLVRVYWPKGDGPFPAVMYFHGGGWVLGDLDTHDALCRRLTNEAQAVVVSVDYRLSPETQFPEPLNDCYAATKSVADNPEEFNVDPQRLVVAGDSAGGNLAAAVALMARDQGGPKFKLQVLLYPALDHTCDSNSYDQFADGYALTKTGMKWFWLQYLGDISSVETALHSPALANDLRGLPPAHIVTAECDVLRDEGERYARRLTVAGVPTTHRRYQGMIHGFVHFCGVFDVGRTAIRDIARVIQAACVADESEEQPQTESGFVDLFDGKSLDGWDGDPEFWRVEDGAIIGETTKDNSPEHNTFLIHRGGAYDNFELRLSYKVEGFNSGVQYRSVDGGDWVVSGYQCDFEARWHTSDDKPNAPPFDRFSGMFFEENGRMFMGQRGESVIVRSDPGNADKSLIENIASVGDPAELETHIKRDDWNELVVIANGNQFTHIINGHVMAMGIDEDKQKRRAFGLFAFQLHEGPPMRIDVKDIRVRTLNAGARPAEANSGAAKDATRAGVTVTNVTLFGDMDCFRVETPSATYVYGKKGAGFASIFDKQGNDWLSYRHGNTSRGEYRGMPKCGQPTKYFHCGYGFGDYQNDNPFESKVTQQTDDHIRIESVTRDGKSACHWDFYSDHATFTLRKMAISRHWFLYEGTPGGKLDPKEDFVIRPSGKKTMLNEYWSEVIPWACFGAVESPAGLLCINHQNPEPGQTDSYVAWPFEKQDDGFYQEMTVFGFGRKGYRELTEHIADLQKLPAKYSIALLDRADHATAKAAYDRLQTPTGAAEE